nr:carbohydrate ABC transporter permease [Geodermatophilaceae bacterium]
MTALAPHQTTSPAARISGYLAMLLVVLLIALPLYWILVSSLKERPDIYTVPVTWFPGQVTFDSYSTVRTGVPFTDYLRNSVLITVLTIVEVTLGVLSAFALSFLRFRGRTFVLLFIIAALLVPNQITLISNYAL